MTDRAVSRVRDLGRLLLGHLRAFRNPRLQDTATRMLRSAPGRRSPMLAMVNLTLRARRSLAFHFYLEPRRMLSHAAFARRGARRGQAGPRRRLSLLCPTRGRVGNVGSFVRSVHRTAAAPDRVEILFYVDDDDPRLNGYREFFAGASARFPRLGRCALHVGEPVGVPEAWNVLAAAATGDLLLMANDDQLYVDYGWDVRLDERLGELTAEHPDEVFCLYFDAGQYPEGACDFPILTRPWYETLGYFTPTIFQQWEVEKWVFDIARRIGRLHSVPRVFVDHRHYQDYKAPFDDTYQRHRITREKSFADHALFLRTEGRREREAARLRKAIADSPRRSPVSTDSAAEQEKVMPDAHATRPESGLHGYTVQSARRFYSQLIDTWNYGGRTEQARECADLAVRQGVWRHPLQRPREFLPDLPTRPVHDPAEFWFVEYLEDNAAKIRAELDSVLGAPQDVFYPSAGEKGLVQAGDWDQAHLFQKGEWQDELCAIFPVTAGIVAGIPEATTLGPGVVSFSRLTPGTHLTPHCGPTNAVLRVHLGVKVPDGPTLRVGDQTLTWQDGKCLIFDDGFEHEVWHQGTEDRIVLILDVLNPALEGDHQRRLMERRFSAEEQILAFMRERGLARVDTRGEEIVFHPDDATADVVRAYMGYTGVAGAELRRGEVRWLRPGDDGAGTE